MRLGLVGRCLNTPHVRGMGRYVQELLRNSAGKQNFAWRIYGDDPRHPLTCPPEASATTDVFSFRGDRLHLWEQLGLPMHARRDGVDVLHCTEGALPWWQPVPTVVTLHDTLVWQEHSDSDEVRPYWDRVLPAALHRCAHVITISESSRRDIVAQWPRLASKITVIPHGISQEYLSTEKAANPGELRAAMGTTPYLVYVGGPMARKRFDWAVQVLEASLLPELHLVVCGFGAEARADASAKLSGSLRERIHFAAFLSDEHLVSLYQGAVAVLYPTLYEGFGFPAIEAQAAGAPVIFSPVSSLAELAGPLSILVDSTDLQGWCSAVHSALERRCDRPLLAAQAREWAKRFSWRHSFEAHLQVYEQAADQEAAWEARQPRSKP